MAGANEFEPRAFRRRRNLVLGRASELIGPILRLGARARSRGSPSDPQRWRNGLILSHNHIGDVLYRTCSLSQLREALPDCRWTFLTTPESAEILEGNPSIESVVTQCTGENSWDLAPGGFADLRNRRFDVVLCTNTLRHYPDLFLATALGIPNRVGFAYKGLSGLLTLPVPISYPSSFPAYFRSMVAHVANLEPDWDLRPRLFPTPSDRESAARAWNESGFDDSRPVVACAITTRQLGANWPPSLPLAILTKAREHIDFDVVLTGTARDESDLRILANQVEFECRILPGTLGLRAFAAFLEKCDAVLTLDSGNRHIANAVGTPVFFLRNPSVSRVESGAYCSTETDLAPPAEYQAAAQVQRATVTFAVNGAATLLAEALRRAEGASAKSVPAHEAGDSS
ncbi:MAG TPA: glycosyltransferase family 9 protein [Gemmatimonadaceae bacterium]